MMMNRLFDLDRTFAAMNQLTRHLDQAFEDVYGERDPASMRPRRMLPTTDLRDDGENLVFEADVPGVKDEDLHLELHQDVLTLRGERNNNLPQGAGFHRRERTTASFSRSFTLRDKVDPEKVAAELTDGVLTITLEKAPEAQPRKISVSQ